MKRVKSYRTAIILFTITMITVIIFPMVTGLISGNLIVSRTDHFSIIYESPMSESSRIIVTAGDVKDYSISINSTRIYNDTIKNKEEYRYPAGVCVSRGHFSGKLNETFSLTSSCKMAIANFQFNPNLAGGDTLRIEGYTTGANVTVKILNNNLFFDHDQSSYNLMINKSKCNIELKAYSGENFVLWLRIFKVISEYGYYSSEIMINSQEAGISEGIAELSVKATLSNGSMSLIRNMILLDYSAPIIDLVYPLNDSVINSGESITFCGVITDATDVISYLEIYNESFSEAYYLGNGTNIYQKIFPVAGNYTWVFSSEDALGHISSVLGNFSVLEADVPPNLYSFVTVQVPSFVNGSLHEENIRVGIFINSTYNAEDYSLVITDITHNRVYINQLVLPAENETSEYYLELWENGVLIIDCFFTVTYLPPLVEEEPPIFWVWILLLLIGGILAIACIGSLSKKRGWNRMSEDSDLGNLGESPIKSYQSDLSRSSSVLAILFFAMAIICCLLIIYPLLVKVLQSIVSGSLSGHTLDSQKTFIIWATIGILLLITLILMSITKSKKVDTFAIQSPESWAKFSSAAEERAVTKKKVADRLKLIKEERTRLESLGLIPNTSEQEKMLKESGYKATKYGYKKEYVDEQGNKKTDFFLPNPEKLKTVNSKEARDTIKEIEKYESIDDAGTEFKEMQAVHRLSMNAKKNEAKKD